MKEEEEKKTTKKTTTKKTTTKKSDPETVEKKKTPAKKKVVKEAKLEEVKEEIVDKPKEEKEEEKEEKKTAKKTTKKTTTKKTAAKKETTSKVKELPPVVEDIEIEKDEEIEVESVPEIEEDKPEVKEEETQSVVNTDALPVVVPEKEEKIIDEVPDDTIAALPLPMEKLGNSVFDGKLIQLIGWSVVGLILTVLTLGLGAPFATCFILDWRFKHTKINGKRLSFDGNGLQLWGNYIKWTFFTIITLGIFLLFLPVQWNKWIVKHTHYEGNRKPKVNYSLFDGITWEYIGISLLSGFINLFTLGLLRPFCDNLMYSWRINHTTYDTIDMEFDGKGFQLLGNYIKWTFFTIITLGIYGLWVPIKKIQWEVKHTHEKGYARHPYKPVLGMVLPVIIAFALLGSGIFGLTRVKKQTWIDIKDRVKSCVNSIIDESEKYDFSHVLVERVADGYYMISNKDKKITWDERYERYFDPTKLDKLSDNDYKDYFDNEDIKIAIVDVQSVKEPVLIVKGEKQIRIFWLFEDKIENHYFNYDEDKGDIKLVTDKKGTHYAYVTNRVDGIKYEMSIVYLDDVVNYDTKSKVYAANLLEFEKKLKEAGIKIEDTEVHYTPFDIKKMDGYDEAVKYYNNHSVKEEKTDSKVYNEDEVNEPIDDSNYRSAYLSYLKNKLSGKAKVAVIPLESQEYPVLVVLEENRSYILSYYDKELYESENLGKMGLTTLKKTTSSKIEYVLVGDDSINRTYYFVESYAKHKSGTYDGERSLKIKKKEVLKGLAKYNYKEINTPVETVSIAKDDMKALEEKLNIKEEAKQEEKEESKETKDLDNLVAGDFKLAYGDYVSDIKDTKGGTYTIMRNGSYSYVNPYAKKNGKTYTIRETGKYVVKMDYKTTVNGKGTGDKVPMICMTSSTKGSKVSEGCWVVDKDNHFKAIKEVNNWTFKR